MQLREDHQLFIICGGNGNKYGKMVKVMTRMVICIFEEAFCYHRYVGAIKIALLQ